jgi:hypothetical protein
MAKRPARMTLLPVVLVLILGGVPSLAFAADDWFPEAIEIHGFVSQGAIKTTANNYLVKSQRGSAEITEVGINFTKLLTDRLRVGLQLFGGGIPPASRYNIKADWFYLDYHWRDWFGIRAGRVKLPFGLYNEVSDIDSTRVSILLPQSVYPITSRNFLLAQTGVELYGYVGLHDAGALEYRLYGGTIQIDLQGAAPTIASLDTPYLVGGRLMWESPVEGLRAGGSIQALRLDAAMRLPAGVVSLQVPALLWVGSIEYAMHDLLLTGEYGRWVVRVDSSDPTLFPASKTVSERLYGMAAYRVSSWLQPGAYYSYYRPDVDVKEGRAAAQHDAAGTLRFDINPHWLVKLEGHFMQGTAGLNAALNGNTPLVNLVERWGVFMVKTTAHF